MKKFFLLFLMLIFPALGSYLYYWGEREEAGDNFQEFSTTDYVVDSITKAGAKRSPSNVTMRFAQSVADSKCCTPECLAKEERVILENEEEEAPPEETNLLCDKEDVSSECSYVCGSDVNNETGVLIKQEEGSEENDSCECSDPKARWNSNLNRCMGGDLKVEPL